MSTVLFNCYRLFPPYYPTWEKTKKNLGWVGGGGRDGGNVNGFFFNLKSILIRGGGGGGGGAKKIYSCFCYKKKKRKERKKEKMWKIWGTKIKNIMSETPITTPTMFFFFKCFALIRSGGGAIQ